MPRVHQVKKARKDNPAVKAGEPYYWWSTRITAGKSYISQKHYSATYPKRSQLTSSPFKSQLYEIEDRIGDIAEDAAPDEIESFRDDIVSDLEGLRDEVQESLDNMPEGLQESSMLNERIENMDAFIDEVQGVEPEEEGAIDELAGISYQGE